MFDEDEEDDFLAPAAPWAVTSKSTSKSGDSRKHDIFSHRNTFDAIARDKAEREKEKAQIARAKQKKLEQSRNEKVASSEGRTSAKRENGGKDERGSFKTRRMNADDRKKLCENVGVPSTTAIDLDDSDDKPEAGLSAPVRRSTRTNDTRSEISSSEWRSGLNKSFDDENVMHDDQVEINTIPISPARPQSPPEEKEDEDSDPEIAELKRKAREDALRRHEQAKKALSPDSFNTGTLPPVPPDATIQLFITSPIPETKELICQRKLSQPLSAVREAWCDRQGYDRVATERIFFTYRGRKLYDSTTVRRLGFSVHPDGTLHREEDPDNEDDGRVHIEAITEEIYQERRAEKERKLKVAAGQYDESAEQLEQDEAPPVDQPLLQKLIVRAKGKPDFKLKVFPSTKFNKIIKAAKKHFGFTDEQNVYITFDDERINPNEEVGSTEMEDMDVVDMFIIG